MGNEEIYCECVKCHRFFKNVECKRVKRMGRVDLVSPCCEREFKVYFGHKTEAFIRHMIKDL